MVPACALGLQPRLILSQVSADRRALEFKKGKLSVLSESMDIATLEASFERTEGFPKDCNPAHVSRPATSEPSSAHVPRRCLK